ncbi:MAG: DUF1343 domain-containing protein, partial [Bacteroidetes bacterium]
PVVRTGARVLADQQFEPLAGRRVGLIVNHTARVDSVHLIDLVAAAPDVELVALFGPEHGLRGEADAGETVEDGRDDRTGVPIYSLYGDTRRPTAEMLDGVDVLVFDIQDIGARFYTYISTMALAMQAAAEHGIAFMVLDRPNPLGGTYVSGFMLEPEQTSFVGQFPIPIAHGMTVGELAQMIRGEGLMDGLETLDLTVIPMEHWSRTQQWPDTGLEWVPTSPNIPDFETALIYPGACFIEATAASEGRGTREPFKLIGAPWVAAQALADTLNGRGLPGLRFEPATFTPRSIEGMASSPKLQDQEVHGVRFVVTDRQAVRPVEAGVHLLEALYRQSQARAVPLITRPAWLARLAGTERLLAMLKDGATPEAIVAAWADEVEAFRRQRAPYLLY